MMRTMRRRDLPLNRALDIGEVAEWSNAPDSKSGLRYCRNVGSNPTLSARQAAKPLTRRLFCGCKLSPSVRRPDIVDHHIAHHMMHVVV